MRRAARALLLALAAGGCAPTQTYLRGRVADVLDAVPASVGLGWGLGASARATPLLHLGLGLSPVVTSRAGYDDRLFHGVWSEYQASFPWSLWAGPLMDLPELPPDTNWFEAGGVPLLYRWQTLRDAPLGEGERGRFFEPNHRSWGRHPPQTREVRGALLFPERRALLVFRDVRLVQGDPDVLLDVGSPERATLWETDRRGRTASRAWDLFEADLVLGFVGLRLGFRPVEALDFLLGLIAIDPLGDDLPRPVAWEPETGSAAGAP